MSTAVARPNPYQLNENRHAAVGRVIRLVRGAFLLLLLVGLVAGAATYLYQSKVVKPTYQAVSTLEVDAPQGGSAGGPTDVFGSEAYATTVAEVLNGYPVATTAYKSLHLRPPLTPYSIQEMTSASAVPNSQLIRESASSRDPIFAARLANAVAVAGQQEEQRLQAARFSQALKQLDQKIQADRSDLNTLLAQNASGRTDPATASQITADQVAIRNLEQQRLDLVGKAAQSATTISIPIPAVPPKAPSSPHPLRTAIIVAVLAVLFTLGLFGVREYVTGKLYGPGEISEVLGGAPVLGGVLRMATSNRSPAALVMTNEPRTSAAEAYRIVRTNLLFANVDSPPKVILVTSARRGEGKTTTAMNLAASMAELGARVLLVDADLRAPSLHKILGAGRAIGLTSTIVSADRRVRPAIMSTSVTNLHVMFSGPLPPNPAELLSSARMREVMSTLRRAFNVIIIDSPPLLAVADAVVLSTMSDAVTLVVDSDTATRHELTRVREALERVGSHISGVVLNRVDADQGAYGYGQGFDGIDHDAEYPGADLIPPTEAESTTAQEA